MKQSPRPCAPADWFRRADERFKRVQLILVSRKLWWGIIIVGAALRFIYYVGNRSLWRDEAALAMNVAERTYAGLFEPLDSHQAAPIGFLVLEKTAVLAFGNSELALRLVPLLAGILSLVLFKNIAARCLDALAVPLALALFAVSAKLIYYSSEVKQYSTDVLIALVVLWMAMRVYSQSLSVARAACFGLAGASVIWFSHPSVFMLAGVCACLFAHSAIEREWKRALLLCGAGALWLASFRWNYSVTLREISESGTLLNYWGDSDAFMPFPPFSIAAVKWLWHSFLLTFQDPAGFSPAIIAGFSCVAGCAAAFANRSVKLLLLIAPAPFALLASGLHKYPFLGRLLLFLIPSIVLLVTKGMSVIGHRSVFIGAVLALVLLFNPIANNIAAPASHEDIKPALNYARDHWREGDAIHIQKSARHAFHYYAARYGFEEFDLLKDGRKRQGKIEKVPGRFRDKNRLWMLLFDFEPRYIEEEQRVLEYMDSLGTRLDEHREKGVAVYLYELNEDMQLPDNERN